VTYLWIDTFGTLQLRSQQATVSHFPTQHVKELLVFLLLNPNLKHTRLKIISLLWPDVSESTGRGRLNTELWRLRTLFRQAGMLPEEILQTNREFISFLPDTSVLIDFAHFRMLANHNPVGADYETERDILSKAAELYKGDFCEDIFLDWCVIERERLSRLYLTVLGRLMHGAVGQGAYEDAIRYGQTILKADPLREEVYRALMVCYVNLGLYSDATRQYHLCAKILWDELRILPLPETISLFDSVLVERYQMQATWQTHPQKQEALRQTYLQYQEASARLSQLFE
jgi:DNA-binding SARP family transcriptional activator